MVLLYLSPIGPLCWLSNRLIIYLTCVKSEQLVTFWFYYYIYSCRQSWAYMLCMMAKF